MVGMKITRIYTGDDDESHFEDLELRLEDRGAGGRISSLERATGIVFRETDGSYDLDFHNAPDSGDDDSGACGNLSQSGPCLNLGGKGPRR